MAIHRVSFFTAFYLFGLSLFAQTPDYFSIAPFGKNQKYNEYVTARAHPYTQWHTETILIKNPFFKSSLKEMLMLAGLEDPDRPSNQEIFPETISALNTPDVQFKLIENKQRSNENYLEVKLKKKYFQYRVCEKHPSLQTYLPPYPLQKESAPEHPLVKTYRGTLENHALWVKRPSLLHPTYEHVHCTLLFDGKYVYLHPTLQINFLDDDANQTAAFFGFTLAEFGFSFGTAVAVQHALSASYRAAKIAGFVQKAKGASKLKHTQNLLAQETSPWFDLALKEKMSTHLWRELIVFGTLGSLAWPIGESFAQGIKKLIAWLERLEDSYKQTSLLIWNGAAPEMIVDHHRVYTIETKNMRSYIQTVLKMIDPKLNPTVQTFAPHHSQKRPGKLETRAFSPTTCSDCIEFYRDPTYVKYWL